jgi:hypothetical protein
MDFHLPTSSDFPDSEVEELLDQLLLVWEIRKKVKTETLALLEWKEWKACPIDENMLRNGIEWLEQLERFNHTRHMIFRDYVWPHSERVAHIHTRSQYIFQYVFWDIYDISYGTFYASIHDILEGVSPFWDIITTIKEGLSESSETIVQQVEWKIALLVKQFFFDVKFHPQSPENIEQAFQDMFWKVSLPSQVVSYIDKACDGFMYTFHELVAWNEHFLEYFHNYIARIRDIVSWKKLPDIQPLFFVSAQWYKHHLNEIHWEYPDLVKHFWDVWHLYDVQTFLKQAERIDDFFWKCGTQDKMIKNLQEDFWFPAYRMWKETMLLIPPIQNAWVIIRPRGKTLLTVPTSQR